MPKKGQPIWRKNFDIKRADLNIAVETMPGFGGLNFLTIDKNYLTKCIWVVEKMDNTATYYLKDELRKTIELTMKKILTDPARCDKIHKHSIKLNWEYFELATKIKNLSIPKLSNFALLSWRKKLFNIQFLSHCWSLPTTWFVDSDGEDLSKYLASFLRERVTNLNLDVEPATAFSVLSTPKGESFSAKEEKESLKILTWIKSTPKLKHWFMSSTTAELVANFPKLPKQWQSKIQNHYNSFRWLPYTYVGPAYSLDYYLETWRGLLHEDLNPELLIKNTGLKKKQIQTQKAELIKKLKLSALEKHWFSVAEDIVWLKGLRKEVYFHGFFVLDLLLKEIGKRSRLSLMQTKYLLPSELPKVLKGKNLSELANERQKFCVIYAQTPKNYKALAKQWTEKGIQVFVGQKARTFLKQQRFEKIKVIQTNELTGTCACPGTAKGIIKIINIPEEMGKMNQGDIMLSHTTFPALVPAMKKAAAIITEDGGITCHAAIVARELQTPCVVGCKHALQILKDGDLVEINANLGTIKKI